MGAVLALLVGPVPNAAAIGVPAARLMRGGVVVMQQRVSIAQGPRRHQETAYARGYDDGYRTGVADGRRGERYDPAESREYRDADGGYTESYGSRDAYRTNYRAGFRQGYEDGYRAGTR
jgi:flagellar biosynthesis/type III secretory pathway protein FliH